MSMQLILGGSGSGKTTRLYETMIRMSMEQEEERYFLIVPEQFTMQTQKEIVTLHPNHGTMNIDIVSFQRLAYRIFEELAVETLTILDDMGKSMIIRKVAAGQKRKLGIYKGHLNQAGFISHLKSMLSELYQYGITVERLEEMTQKAESRLLKQKLEDFAVIYRGFQEYTHNRFITTEEILDVLCRVLPDSLLIRNSVVALDGFTGFTPVQNRVIEQFLIRCRKVLITVTIDGHTDPYQESRMQNLFYMSKHMIGKLMGLVRENQIEKKEDLVMPSHPSRRFGEHDALEFLEQELYRYSRKTYRKKQDQISICRAQNPAGEISFVVSKMHQLVKEEGLRYRDMAVVTGDLASYGIEVLRQFEDNDIPFFMDDKKNILEHPMVELIRAAQEVVQKDFTYESVFRYLKTGLVTDSQETQDRLENYVVALGIRGFKRWNSTWEYGYRGGKNLNLDELNALREEILSPLKALREALRKEDANVRSMTQALTEFLMEIHTEQKVQTYEAHFHESGEFQLEKEYSQVYGLVMDLFDRCVKLLGEEKVSRREYAEILDAGFAEIKVGVIPATVDRVVVGDIKRTRLDHIQVLFFIGVNDGIIPGKKDGGSLLSDMERTFLGRCRMELAPSSREEGLMQRFYLYLMMTKPGSQLVLTYSAVSASGKSQRPSSLIGEVRKLFPEMEITDAKTAVSKIESVTEGKARLIEGLRRYDEIKEDRQFLELYRWFFQSADYGRDIRALVEAAFYTYEGRGIGKAAAKALYGPVLSGSVTRLEQYASCAYAHFLNYGLELMERQEYELAAVDIGNLFHHSIDLCFQEVESQGRQLSDLTVDERTALVKGCVGQITGQYGNTIMQSSARNAYLARKVERITDRTIWALTEQMKKGDFVPAGFEVSFSAIDNLKAMKIALSREEALHLQGRIDRLDLCEDENHIYVKIIDYKSGSTSFDLAALYYGLQLQLVVYMDAVMELEERKHPHKEVVPAGIFYYNINDPLIEKKDGICSEEIDREILRQLRMNGLVNSELEVIRHLDSSIEKESDVIPVAMKDGLVQEAKSSVANQERFEALRRYVKDKLVKAGQEILKGDTEVKPYKQGNKSACDYCPYHAVCGFDRKTAGYDYRRFKAVKSEEVWADVEDWKGEADGSELDPKADAGN